MTDSQNPTGMLGIEFVEFSSPRPEKLDELFLAFGFSRLSRHRNSDIVLYKQNDILFLLAQEPSSFAESFHKDHGPSICAMGFRVENAQKAFDEAVARGAKPYTGPQAYDAPAIYGIGQSLIYFVDSERYLGHFTPLQDPKVVEDKGFLLIDHLTNNVPKGGLAVWSKFYKDVFAFTEVRYFDIKGAATGLTSYALRSPCGTFCIPINEGNEEKSQIEEYLREYKGPGIQHLAFLTDDLLGSLDKLKDTRIETLDIDDEYYNEVFERVPNVSEDKRRIREHQVLVDGDDDGYLLQIFTRNIIGPIFIEMIQRKNHLSFGEGNFGALFRSIEKDQERRGVL